MLERYFAKRKGHFRLSGASSEFDAPQAESLGKLINNNIKNNNTYTEEDEITQKLISTGVFEQSDTHNDNSQVRVNTLTLHNKMLKFDQDS